MKSVLDRLFEIFPKRFRCNQLRIFLAYRIVVDYLKENGPSNFVTEMKNGLDEIKEKIRIESKKSNSENHYLTIDLLEAYFKFHPASEVISSLYNDVIKTFKKYWLISFKRKDLKYNL